MQSLAKLSYNIWPSCDAFIFCKEYKMDLLVSLLQGVTLKMIVRISVLKNKKKSPLTVYLLYNFIFAVIQKKLRN